MTTYTSTRAAYSRWIDSVHNDPNWRSPTAERKLLTVPVIPGYQALPPTQVAENAPDRMTLGQWFLAIGGLVVIILFLLAVFLPVFI